MKFLRNFSRITLGLVFIFSGFVKAIDPLGSAYKFGDYFEAFHMEFLDKVTLPLALLLSTLEFIIGFALLLKLRMRLFSRLITIFMVFFLFLTLYIAIKNPVTDCGCFGDALILTNSQTFFKNLFLMAFVAIVYISRNKFEPAYSLPTEWTLTFAGLFLIVGISVHCLKHLPIIDFRPYNVGTYIPEKMIIPEDAPPPKYITYLYYEKNGKVEEFIDPDYPWDDTTWTFVDAKSEMIDEGYIPPIHDFTITNPNGEDITDMVLNNANYSLLLISHDLEKVNKEALLKFKYLYEQLGDEPFAFYCMTSSPTEYSEKLTTELNLPYKFFATDEVTLKTIVRSNPGLVLLKSGVIIDKWHYNDFPCVETFKSNAEGKIIEGFKKHIESLRIINLILYIILILSLFKLFRQYFKQRKS